MNHEDIKITVLTTLADATTSIPERQRLLDKIEDIRYGQVMRTRHRNIFLLKAILYVSIGIFLSFTVGALVPFLISPLTESQPSFDRHSPFDSTPFDIPARRHSP
jgi:hypothetical protein